MNKRYKIVPFFRKFLSAFCLLLVSCLISLSPHMAKEASAGPIVPPEDPPPDGGSSGGELPPEPEPPAPEPEPDIPEISTIDVDVVVDVGRTDDGKKNLFGGRDDLVKIAVPGHASGGDVSTGGMSSAPVIPVNIGGSIQADVITVGNSGNISIGTGSRGTNLVVGMPGSMDNGLSGGMDYASAKDNQMAAYMSMPFDELLDVSIE